VTDQMPTEAEIRAAVAGVLDRVLGAEVAARADAAAATAEAATGPIAVLAIGADHGGFELKERLAADLRDRGITVRDCGTRSTDPVDYPDIAHAVARKVASGEVQVGIVIDGAGIGSAMAANKLPGVRAATCWDISSARNSREHNYANVLCLGAGLLGANLASQIVDAWLSTAYGAARHGRRVAKIGQLEQRYGTRLT
jgi:ribose 5-phosphate isomerase B